MVQCLEHILLADLAVTSNGDKTDHNNAVLVLENLALKPVS